MHNKNSTFIAQHQADNAVVGIRKSLDYGTVKLLINDWRRSRLRLEIAYLDDIG